MRMAQDLATGMIQASHEAGVTRDDRRGIVPLAILGEMVITPVSLEVKVIQVRHPLHHLQLMITPITIAILEVLL